jgi:DNA-binding XRE family transcriptional regulator
MSGAAFFSTERSAVEADFLRRAEKSWSLPLAFKLAKLFHLPIESIFSE